MLFRAGYCDPNTRDVALGLRKEWNWIRAARQVFFSSAFWKASKIPSSTHYPPPPHPQAISQAIFHLTQLAFSHLFIFRAKIQVIILLPLMFRLILNSTHFGKHYVTGSQKSQGILNKHCLRMHEFVAFKHALWQCLSRANNNQLELEAE